MLGACAAAWPPATTSAKPTAGQGVTAAKLGTTKRSDGTLEITNNGHPLYYNVSDTNPGDTTGPGLKQFGADWYVVAPVRARGGTAETRASRPGRASADRRLRRLLVAHR